VACLVVLFAACLWPGGVLAHPFSSSLSDADGRAHAVKLLDSLGAAEGDVSNQAFQELFLQDPNLSKRAFVALIDRMLEVMESDRPKAEACATAAAALATLIEQQFGDSQPTQIVAALTQGQESSLTDLVAYLQTLKPAAADPNLSEENYGFNAMKASDIPAQAFDQLRPFLLKLLRIQYATAVANPQLTIQELDTYAGVEETFEKAMVALGVSAQEADLSNTADTERMMALRRLTVLAEIGLLEEFETGVRALLQTETDNLNSTAVLLSGFRAAYRQNRADLAEGYLRQARELLSRPETPSDPVLEYAVRTAEYQLRRLRGYSPDEKEAAAEFDKAWSALASYKPLTIIRHEANWYYGRMATRYWMDELEKYPESGMVRGLGVIQQMVNWVSEVEAAGGIERLTLDGDDGLLRPDETFGVFALLVALTDQLSYVMESVPAVMETEGMLPLVAQLEELTGMFVDLQTTMGLTAEGPGFPPYDIRSGGLVPELEARCRYLEGISADTPREQRAARIEEAVSSARRTQNPEVTVDYLLKSGRKLADLGRYDQAIAVWKEALGIAEEMSFVLRSLDAASLLAKEYGRRGDWVNAASYAERATQKIQETAPLMGLASEESQLMAARTQELTSLSVKAAVEADDPEKALAALTRSQQVQSAAVQMEGQKQAQAEVRNVLAKEEQVVALAHQVKNLEAMPSSGTRDGLLKSSQQKLAETRAEFLTQSRELRKKYSELYSKVLRFDPLDLPEIQRTLPSDVAVLQYFPTDDALYIFLVSKDKFRLHQVSVGQKVLDAAVTDYVKAIKRPGLGDAALQSEGMKLYGTLFAPIKEDIAACKTLVLIPSGRLNSLPFASLPDASGKPLIEDKEILELAKSTDLMRMAGESPKPVASLVAFANATGDLPAAAQEGDQIASLFDRASVKLFKGKEATADAFLTFGAQADALHLATHGEWDTQDSLRNYLAMANQQKVSQDQIFELGLENTSIVILSACNTAMGEGGDVKYVASLAEAFWIAGSRSVVASLWAVNDESTAILMTEFYRSLRSGDGKATALKKAQLAVRSQKQFQHPYFWAGFILFGDWR
jgi:CHAT domain-containing protein